MGGLAAPTTASMPRELAVPTHRSQRRLSGRMTGQPPNRPFANRILEHNHVEKSQLGGSSHSRQATPGQHKAAAECTQPKASNLRCRPVTDQVQSDYPDGSTTRSSTTSSGPPPDAPPAVGSRHARYVLPDWAVDRDRRQLRRHARARALQGLRRSRALPPTSSQRPCRYDPLLPVHRNRPEAQAVPTGGLCARPRPPCLHLE
jgi:hypothetical protein